ncbi:hypothetical protein E0W68_02955 [Flavobacterium salilacus subsp. salilacus]|uniref:hypothetical protein n=1 Tax=Flavobacterium TaxID=237 RepID=UPI0010756FD6|nr:MULTISPECIES: hypothetical protein [Flavobacterium]KAF2520198.1 hypothetical protein E0W68_02955 [Flavobacterium salilacus subsp. salilacus]MBE1613885.1 hypothetical protein [Flavobacterium sp. SaA2.13]
MKKVIFSVAACLAFAGSTFAENGKVINQKSIEEILKQEAVAAPCGFRFIITDRQGNILETVYGMSNATTENDCALALRATALAAVAAYQSGTVLWAGTSWLY